MNKIHKHLTPITRRFPSALPISIIGHLPEKSNWVRCAFNTCNFSFILKGEGQLWVNGKKYPIEAPCVFMQPMGVYQKYGPTPSTTWQETYFVYEMPTEEALKKSNLLNPHRIIWPICRPSKIARKIEAILELVQTPEPFGVIDQIDRMVESLIVESLIVQTPEYRSQEEQIIYDLHNYVEQHFLEKLDFKALAAHSGLSYTTFRRHWANRFDLSPGQFLRKLRIQEACRLLVESNLSIGEIAFQLHFEDPLYFSRRFKKEMSRTPSQYRNDHRLLLQL